MVMTYELQFTDGFYNIPAIVRLDGRPLEKFELNTKLQTGLATIYPFDAKPGQKLEIAFPTLDELLPVSLDREHLFLIVSLSGGHPVLKLMAERQGYL